MHVIVVGGGVVGIAAAFELQRRGHTVEVFERNAELAQETSFANGGLLTPGMCEPWNAPGIFGDLLSSLTDAKSPMKLHLSAIPGLLGWGLQFLRNATPERFWANTEASYQLSDYSVGITNQWVRDYQLQCDYRASGEVESGDIKIFADRKAADFSLALANRLAKFGLDSVLLETEQVLALEPSLDPIKDKIACGLRFPGDAAGDARKFTQALGRQFEALGGVIHREQTVSAIAHSSGKALGVLAGKQYEADRVLVCAAHQTPALLAPLGISLPIKPVKGYSLTLDVSHVDRELLPKRGVINQAMHAAVNPLGNRVRVAGTAEFVRTANPDLPPERVANLMDLLATTYPRLAACLDAKDGEAWCGFRPMSTDGRPFIGASKINGLFVNSGHGYLGWTQAAGSATLIADLMEGRPCQVSPELFALER